MASSHLRPLVGIPTCLDAAERIRAGRRTHYLDETYARAILEAGGCPVYLPTNASAVSGELLDRLQGLVLPGGDDLLPDTPYPADVVFDAVAPDQLVFDRALLAGALERGLPLLGICYGMQLLALHCGGHLLYDLPSDRPAAGPHRLPEADGRHPLRIAQGTRLADILGTGPTQVNSLHHQGVAEPGAGLRACAWAGDGTLEAIESTRRDRFVLGVQWHPEKLSGAARTALFAALVSACGSP